MCGSVSSFFSGAPEPDLFSVLLSTVKMDNGPSSVAQDRQILRCLRSGEGLALISNVCLKEDTAPNPVNPKILEILIQTTKNLTKFTSSAIIVTNRRRGLKPRLPGSSAKIL